MLCGEPAGDNDVEEKENERERHQHRLRHEPEREEEPHESEAPAGRTYRVAGVRPESEHPEESAQHVLPFRRPGNGFDVERVQCKQDGNNGAAPQGAGHLPQKDKQ